MIKNGFKKPFEGYKKPWASNILRMGDRNCVVAVLALWVLFYLLMNILLFIIFDIIETIVIVIVNSKLLKL